MTPAPQTNPVEAIAAAGYEAWCDDPGSWAYANGMERRRWTRIAEALSALTAAPREGWVLVPMVGTEVKADHPKTCLNPTETFEVIAVEVDSLGARARGENTCWFGVSLLAAAPLPREGGSSEPQGNEPPPADIGPYPAPVAPVAEGDADERVAIMLVAEKGVANTLRTLLHERNHRTDGDLQSLADRCLHLSRGDRDLIAMQQTAATLAAPPAAEPVAEGWVLVPREPTEGMLASFWRECTGGNWSPGLPRLTKRQMARARAAYRDLLKFAPTPPAARHGEDDVRLSLIGCAHLVAKNHPEVSRLILKNAEALSAPGEANVHNEGHAENCACLFPGDRDCNCHKAYGFDTAEDMDEANAKEKARAQADAASAWRLVIDAANKSPRWGSTRGTNIDRVLALLAEPSAPTDAVASLPEKWRRTAKIDALQASPIQPHHLVERMHSCADELDAALASTPAASPVAGSELLAVLDESLSTPSARGGVVGNRDGFICLTAKDGRAIRAALSAAALPAGEGK